ncbi:MAG: TlpA disulfide reductase family protein [Actinomycetota bacterium]|nr:TlpA disulfide reductase family protein [Actinomycetota bacterium]
MTAVIAAATGGIRWAVAALAAGALLAGCAGTAAGSPGPASGSYEAVDGSITVLSPAERNPAPDVAGTTLDGGRWSLAEHRGQVVVLNVWASWCAPCRAEAPALKSVSEEFAGQGVAFVGLNTRDSDVPALAFERRYAISYPSLVDRDGRLQLLFAGDLNPNAIPSTVVVDRDGRVAARILGRASEATLRSVLTALLDEDRASESAGSTTDSTDAMDD